MARLKSQKTLSDFCYGGLVERYDLFKPVLAAVDGYAGAVFVSSWCDLIIATTRSTFGLPEPLIGAVAVGGGVHRLSRQIGQNKLWA